MTNMVIEPLDSTLGATVTGVDLCRLSDQDWQVIYRAFLDRALLIFPGQHLDSQAQREFGLRFGPLETALVGDKGVIAISNLDPDGALRSAEHPVMAVLRGNEGWHTDSSYMPVSAKASVLSARQVPSTGGHTEWADMRAAYEALDDDTRNRLSALSAHHSLVYSQDRAGQHQPSGYGIGVDAEPLRPLVKVHPETGRPALFIGRHAHEIVGLPATESEQLLDDLLEAACAAPRTHLHRWSPGDVVVWDNRCVLHRVHGYDYGEPRVMMHTRIAGDPRTESGTAFRPVGVDG